MEVEGIQGDAPVTEPVESTPAEPVAAPAASESLYEFSEPRDVPVVEPEPAQEPVVEAATETPIDTAVNDGPLLADDDLPPLGPQAPTLESLQQEIERLQKLVPQQQPAQEQPGQQQQQPAAPTEPEVFVTDEQHEELLADPAKFNGFMREFKRNTQVEAITAAEAYLTPRIMQAASQQAFEIVEHAMSVKDFYSSNPELQQYPQEAQKVYEALNAKYPSFTPQQLLAATARETKRRLQSAGIIKQPPAKLPVVAPPTGVRPAVSHGNGLTGLKAEIAEFLGH